MLKRHEIQVLRRAGHGQAEVAELTGVSERTVRRIEQESPVGSVQDAGERQKRGIGRPGKVETFRKLVKEILAEKPALKTLEILRRARRKGYRGGKSAFYELVASVRPRPVRAMVRFEGLPGEFTQHDFGHVTVHFVNGTKKRIHFFASRLKYSRWVQVTIVPNEKVEPLVRTLVDHFEAMGGIPLLAVFDQPKTVVLSFKDGEVLQWNPVFAQVTLDLGLGAEVCWPGRGNQKGSVENLVGWVKGSFFKQRRFLDEEDLYQQLAEWHEEVNTKTPSRATGVTPLERMAEERARLRPLRIAPQDLALKIPVYVGPTGMVLHETHEYSMPADAIGIAGTLHLYQDRLRIVVGRYEAVHERLFEPKAKSVLPEHRADLVAKVSGRRAKRYLMRQQLLDAGGEPALAYLTELVHRRPRQWIHEVEKLHELLQEHGDEAVRAALEKALSQNTFGAEYVEHCLAAGSDSQGRLAI